MIKFEHTEVMGWEAAIRGMRNPMNSWARSDSGVCQDFKCGKWGENDKRPICPFSDPYRDGNCGCFSDFIIGPNDHDLMMRLVNSGPVHAKFRRMIVVYVDITAPLYWWKEFDTYKVGTIANSCSTMHKIADKEFTLEDFSCEHLIENEPIPTRTYSAKAMMEATIENLNQLRKLYIDVSRELKDVMDYYCVVSPTKDDGAVRIKSLQELKKTYWWQMIQLLPSSYNQKRTVMLNYEVLSNIYKNRKDHKLDEWREHEANKIDITTMEDLINGDHGPHYVDGMKEYFGFCDWIKTLPYSELITGPKKEEEDPCMNCFQPKPSDEDLEKAKEVSQTIWDLTQILLGKEDILSKYPSSTIAEALEKMAAEKNKREEESK